ncbi:hypothetical protein WJX79_004952 [Trebouxia sp. C0005]
MPGEPDYLRMAELQPFLPTALYEDELPDYIQQRRNKDLLAPGSQTWSPELLGFCQQADLLMLNGRALEDEVKETWTQKRNVELSSVGSPEIRSMLSKPRGRQASR